MSKKDLAKKEIDKNLGIISFFKLKNMDFDMFGGVMTLEYDCCNLFFEQLESIRIFKENLDDTDLFDNIELELESNGNKFLLNLGFEFKVY